MICYFFVSTSTSAIDWVLLSVHDFGRLRMPRHQRNFVDFGLSQ
jgi:hypothetical protein